LSGEISEFNVRQSAAEGALAAEMLSNEMVLEASDELAVQAHSS
jgi:hypothetical protein